MAQHDNGRRAGGTQSGAWQQGHGDQHGYSSNQQDQASGGRYGAQQGGGQQAGAHGHQDQYDSQRGQQGDNWGAGGQASDNDYGNRGITESGNFRNDGSRRDSGNDGAPPDRDNNPAKRASSQVGAGANAGQASTSGEGAGQQGGASEHDVSNGGDQGAGKTTTR